jgi:hypothetical protein
MQKKAKYCYCIQNRIAASLLLKLIDISLSILSKYPLNQPLFNILY